MSHARLKGCVESAVVAAEQEMGANYVATVWNWCG